MLSYNNHFIGNNYLMSALPSFNNYYNVYFTREKSIEANESAEFLNPFSGNTADYYTRTAVEYKITPIVGTDNYNISACYAMKVKNTIANDLNEDGANVWLTPIKSANKYNSSPYHIHHFNKFTALNNLSLLKYSINPFISDIYSDKIINDFYDTNLTSCNGRYICPNEIKSWEGLENLKIVSSYVDGYTDYGMFAGSDLSSIPSSWNLPSLENSEYMFWCNYKLQQIPSSWNGLSSLQTAKAMFDGCSLSALPSSWDGLENLKDAFMMFKDINIMTHILDNPVYLTSIPTWSVLNTTGGIIRSPLSGLKVADYMFSGCEHLKKLESVNFRGLNSLNSMIGMFSNCDLSETKINSWTGLSSIFDASYAFANTNLTSIPTTFDGFGRSGHQRALYFNNLFENSKITNIPTTIPSGWLKINVPSYSGDTHMEYMFANCTALNVSAKPIMDYIRARSGGGYQGIEYRMLYFDHMFSGCNNLLDKSLSANSNYSAFF